jgi:hypothetical protein
MKNWVTSILAKFFGNGFIKKHVTTLIGFIAGYLYVLGQKAGIDEHTTKTLIEALTEYVLPLALYFLSLLIDARPETPKIVKK